MHIVVCFAIYHCILFFFIMSHEFNFRHNDNKISFVLTCLLFFLPTVLDCIRSRFNTRVFYTSAGNTLVAVNPFETISALYGSQAISEYFTAAKVSARSKQFIDLSVG